MKVMGVGFGRTGTASLQTALEQLGFGPCYHMWGVIAEPHRIRHWLDLGDGRGADWDKVFAGYGSAVDWPAASYWRELAEHYADAKVVLTVRDPKRWYDSIASTIFENILDQRRRSPRQRVVNWLVARRSPDLARFPRLLETTIVDRAFGGRVEDRDHVLSAFDRHVVEVKAAIPDERLLVFDVAEGWEPLCAFLGVPVPDEPFPRSNDRAAFHRDWSRHLRQVILHGR
ncbi:sulfotransferase family protein [Actinomadura sp. 9N215]|uniref:sulfotransferase family protein n=1 Tax=Actinomadura sp. 9N215 TaxID=3375150 RepID=UPI00378F27EF